MRKYVIIMVMSLFWTVPNVIAQSSNAPLKAEMVTSLVPKDEIPLKFSTVNEMDTYVPDRIAELKQLVVDFQHDPDKANFYREELWRVENALVEIK